MAKLNKWDSKHKRNISFYTRQIELIYQSVVREAASIGAGINNFNPDKPFSFTDYPQTKVRVDTLLKTLQNKVQTVVINGVNAEWTLSNNKNNELSHWVFGDKADKLLPAQHRKYFSTNDAARKAFITRKTDGLNLSDRVWKYTSQFKEEIEMGLDLGIGDGLSADEMARDLRQYLQQPDKLFRRVRDKHGQLHLSKRAAAYHPGAGIYRSSRKNAMRLTRDVTNTSYREADHERWQQLDFVVGIEIKLSGSHPVHDICDLLVGKYPKGYKFTGFHVQCFCIAIPILKTPKELQRDTERILNGEETDNVSQNRITDMPDNFNDWVIQNDNRIAKANEKGVLPYFLKDNRRLWADLSTVEIINKKTIDKTIKLAGVFDEKSKAIANSLNAYVTPVNIKSEKRIIDKAINDYKGDISKVGDIVRNTFVVDASDVERIISAIGSKFDVYKYKHQKTNMGYSGHLLQVWIKDGVKAEIQVNTPQMIYAKEPTAKSILGDKRFNEIHRKSGEKCGLGHKYYEEYRTLVSIQNKTKEQLNRIDELQNISKQYYKKIGSVII